MKKKKWRIIIFFIIFINIIALNLKTVQAMCVRVMDGVSGLTSTMVDNVFIGKVVDIKIVESEYLYNEHVYQTPKKLVTFKVEKTLKGKQDNFVSVFSPPPPPPSTGYGFEYASDAINFKQGKRYKVYARTQENNSLYVDSCSGAAKEIYFTSGSSISRIISLIIFILVALRSFHLVFTKNNKKKLPKIGLIAIIFYIFIVSIIFVYANLYIDSEFLYWLPYIVIFLPLNILIIDWFKYFFRVPADDRKVKMQ